jgi:putative ABC transport system permease protein
MNFGPILRAMKHNRTRVVLIVLEIAMTLAIVTNCVNIILAERRKMSQQSGFDDDHLVRMLERPFAPEFRDDAYLDNSIDRDVRTIAAIPGVRAVANTTFQLWEGGGSGTGIYSLDHPGEPVSTQIYAGTKDLMQTLGAEVIEGRGFRDGDHGVGHQPDPANNVILSKSVADLLFPGGSAVGRQVQMGRPGAPVQGPLTVVGVIRTFYNPFGRADTVTPQGDRVMFLPSRVGGPTRGIPFLIRVQPGAMKSVMAEAERRLTAINAGRIFEFKTVTEKRSGWFSGNKIVVTTMTCIIVTLIAVTALGLLGLTSLAVSERTKQIGTRRALGATRTDILRYFLIENWILTTAGLVLGVAGAYALNLLLVAHVSDVKLQWQLVFGGMLLLWINGLVSTIPPAVRAMAISPSIATRSV